MSSSSIVRMHFAHLPQLYSGRWLAQHTRNVSSASGDRATSATLARRSASAPCTMKSHCAVENIGTSNECAPPSFPPGSSITWTFGSAAAIRRVPTSCCSAKPMPASAPD